MSLLNNWARCGARVRTHLKLAGLGLVLAGLTACGGGSVHEPFQPGRIISFGDNLSFVGGNRYSVNVSGEVLTVIEQVAASYGLSTSTTATFVPKAEANARVNSTASFATSTSIAAQVTAYTGSFAANDMVVVSAGTVDLIDEYVQNTSTRDSKLNQAAVDFANVVKTLVSRGAKRVIVVPPYDLSITPWGKAQADGGAALKTLVRTFNDTLKAQLASADGRVVVYADVERELNLIITNNSLSLTDRTTPICDPASSALDAANGIGIGTNELNSSKCTSSTLISVSSSSGTVTATVSSYAFADKVYPTPVVQRQLGASIYSYAYSR